jgi:hypothetical protein
MSTCKQNVASLALGAVLLLGAALPSWADGAPIGRSAAASPLEGSWNVVLTPYDCVTGAPLTFATFRSRISFAAGGPMTETTFNPSFQPGQRSPGLGFWERTGSNTYHTVFEAYIYFTSPTTPPAPPRYTRGHQRVDQSLEMVDADHWTSTALVSFTDVGDNPVSSGCVNATGVRMQ